MRRTFTIYLLIAILVLGVRLGTAGQGQDPKEAPPLDAKALDIIKASGTWLIGLRSLAVHAEILFDEVYGEGTKIQVSGQADLLLKRPDRFKVSYASERDRKSFYFDGIEFLVHDGANKRYAAARPPVAEAGAVVDFAAETLDTLIPLSDLLLSQGAYGLDEIRAAAYLGQVKLGDVLCDQVFIVLDDMNVQIWVQAGPEPAMRKYLMTYSTLEGAPQYAVQLSGWKVAPEIPEAAFKFVPAAGDEKIEFLAREKR